MITKDHKKIHNPSKASWIFREGRVHPVLGDEQPPDPRGRQEGRLPLGGPGHRRDAEQVGEDNAVQLQGFVTIFWATRPRC